MRSRDSARAILDAFRFDGRPHSLAGLGRGDMEFADRAQLTLLLSRFDLAAPVREHVEAALARNTVRVERVRAAYQEIAPRFEHVVLKGFTHAPAFIDDLRLRVQYDLDLYVPPSEHGPARDALLSLSYEPIRGMEGLAMDHLPTMVRRTGWEWRGDYFDPEMPVASEVHFRFWDARTERLRPGSLEGFWDRRDGERLALVDMLGYASLHLVRHLLRGNIRPFHVWEIARFLHTQHDGAFWRLWKQWHSPALRRLEVVAFLLARSWFACELVPEAEEEIAALPEAVHRWFKKYGWSPIDGMFRPNRRELWLHLALVETAADRRSVLRRRLLPMALPGPVDAVHIPEERMTMTRRLKKQARYAAYVAARAFQHVRLVGPTLLEGVNWWWSVRRGYRPSARGSARP